MTIGIVPDISNEEVVCPVICGHKECSAKRALWRDARCDTCKKPMLPGQAYYLNQEGKPEHATCAFERKRSCRT